MPWNAESRQHAKVRGGAWLHHFAVGRGGQCTNRRVLAERPATQDARRDADADRLRAGDVRRSGAEEFEVSEVDLENASSYTSSTPV